MAIVWLALAPHITHYSWIGMRSVDWFHWISPRLTAITFHVVGLECGMLSPQPSSRSPLPTLDHGLRLGDQPPPIGRVSDEPSLSHCSDLARRHTAQLNPTFPADLRFHFLSGSALGFDPDRYAHTLSR